MTREHPPPVLPPLGARVTIVSIAATRAGGWAGRSGIVAAIERSEMPALVEVLFDHGDSVLMLPKWVTWDAPESPQSEKGPTCTPLSQNGPGSGPQRP